MEILLRRRGTPQWDAVIRASGLVALLAIPLTLRWADVAAFAGFLCVTIAVNGPASPLLPATYEPILMVMARIYPAWLVAQVGIIGILYIEYINFYVYRAALLHPKADAFRESRVVRATMALFRKSPFFCIWLCAWSPLPYYVARMAAAIDGYSLRRYFLATFLGRMPRLWFFAALGHIVPIPTLYLIVLTVFMIVMAVIVSFVGTHIRVRRSRALAAEVVEG
jgi:uncharacterized membrane protein YdjX (TVP38/TMEM64 family)